MSERSLINNGRFVSELSGWTTVGAPSYLPSDGDAHYGMASLNNGDSISQTFGVGRARSYTLHLAVKASATLEAGDATVTIKNSDGDTVISESLSGNASGWTESNISVGLGSGSYEIVIANGSAKTVKVDDIWMWYVPVTRAGIAARVHAKLGSLATDKSLSADPDGSLAEGDYSYAIDSGLRQAGAINLETDEPDIRYLETADIDTVLDLVEMEMLEKLQREYATSVDLTVGPRSENRSQTARMLERMVNGGQYGGGGGNRRVIMRPLKHGRDNE